MTQLQQKVVELLDLGYKTDEIARQATCTKAYVSMLRNARRGTPKYLTARLRAEIDYLWFEQDASAGEIAQKTKLPIEKVIAVVLEMEREAARCRA